jgi:exopolysaccharide biosynthesis polyprenyl glycosylphosphotransferase
MSGTVRTGADAGRPALEGSLGHQAAEFETVPFKLIRHEASNLNFWRDTLFRRSLLIADILAFSLAIFVLSLVASRPLQFTLVTFGGLCALVVGAKIFGLYDRDEAVLHKTTLEEAPKLFHIATLGALCAWLAGGFVIAGGTLDRGEALFLWCLLSLFLVLGRAGGRAIALRLAPVERCLFIGDPAAGKTIESKLHDHGLKAELVASVAPAEIAAWSSGGYSMPRLGEIRNLARTLDVQRAIIGPEAVEPERMLDLICTLETLGIKISMLPRMLEVVGSSVEFDDLHGVTLMGVRRFKLTRSSAFVKRCFDLVGTLLGLIAVAPVMIAIAIAIRLDSRGSVFFKQPRIGRGGEPFVLIKFRTMVPEADSLKDSLRDRNEAVGGLFKIADDPRITRVGRFLRKSSLDELPQLINVVRGEMSLVGPRPLPLDEDPLVTGWFRRRLELTPGMTGPWQILGAARVPLRQMGAMDYLYVANWSLWGDVKLLCRTVGHVFGRKGL